MSQLFYFFHVNQSHYREHSHVVHVVGITSLEFVPPVYDFVLTVRPRNGWRGVLDTTVCDKGCP